MFVNKAANGTLAKTVYTQHMKQPDFSKVYLDYFGSEINKVRYEVRDYPYLPHDVQFVHGLIHDADFKLAEIEENENELTLILNRFCSEYGRIAKGKRELKTTSKLKFSGVRKTRWALNDVGEIQSKSLEINNFFVGEDSIPRSDTLDLVLIGYPFGWELRVSLDSEDFEVVIQDIAAPSDPRNE